MLGMAERPLDEEATPRASFQQTRIGRGRLGDAQEVSGGRFMFMFAAAYYLKIRQWYRP